MAVCLAGALLFGPPAMAADTVTVGDVVYTCGASTATVSDYLGPQLVPVTIPASVDCPGGSSPVTVVGKNAFANGGLWGIVLPEGVERVGEGAFWANNLGALTLPSTLKVLDYGAFSMSGVTTVTLPQGLTTIGRDAFFDTDLSAVTIPASVRTMDAGSFSTSKMNVIAMLGPVPSSSGDPFGHENRQRDSTVLVSVHDEYLDAYRAAGWESFPSVAALRAFDAPAPAPEPKPVPSPSPSPTADATLPANAGLRVSPADAAPGTRITVSGSDFPADVESISRWPTRRADPSQLPTRVLWASSRRGSRSTMRSRTDSSVSPPRCPAATACQYRSS